MVMNFKISYKYNTFGDFRMGSSPTAGTNIKTPQIKGFPYKINGLRGFIMH